MDSLIIKEKKDETLRLCPDSKDLRLSYKHFKMTTAEDVAAKRGARKYSRCWTYMMDSGR